MSLKFNIGGLHYAKGKVSAAAAQQQQQRN